MRYRDSIQQQLDRLEGKLTMLEFLVKTKEPLGKYLTTITEAKEYLSEAKSYLDREPASQGERSGLM